MSGMNSTLGSVAGALPRDFAEHLNTIHPEHGSGVTAGAMIG